MFCALGAAGAAAPASRPGLFVSANGSDSARCTASAPCRSFNRAYRLARPGQVIGVLAGAYPRQVLDADPRKTSSKDVLFRPEPSGAAVTVDWIEDSASHVEFRSLHVSGSWRALEATDVTFRRVITSRFVIASSTKISVLGGRVGPTNNASNDIGPIDRTTTRAPQSILIDGVTITGFHQADGESHVDCLHVWGVTGLVVRRSRFRDCEHFDMLLNWDGSAGPPQHVLVENNFFDCCRSGYYSVYVGGEGGGYHDILVRNNSSDKAMGVHDAATVSGNVRFLANVAPGFDGCGHRGVIADYNVWTRGSCGPHDRRGSTGFVDPAHFDFHLGRGAAAINHGDPKSYPRRDIDGQRRPVGRRADAGADERS